MKLLIIGPKKSRQTDIEMMHCAKKHFEKVLYTPITRIAIESSDKGVVPFLKNTNLLTFDVVLARVEKEYRDIGYVLAKIFEDNGKYVPIDYKAILMGSSEFLVPVYFGLKNNGIKSLKTYFTSSKQAIFRNFQDFNYPITIKLPYRKEGDMVANSKESAIGIIDTMEKLDQPILIQETVKNSEKLRILVAGKRVYALKDETPVKLSSHDERLILQTARTIGAKICQIYATVHENKIFVSGINITPKMMVFEKIFNEKVIDNSMKDLRENADRFYEKINIPIISDLFLKDNFLKNLLLKNIFINKSK